MIELREITKIYGSGPKAHTALNGLNLTVDKGQIFGVIGHSGAGKSTLIRCINLLERPTSGEVRIGGIDLTALGKRELQLKRRKIGMIFQHFNLLSSASVYDNIAFPLRLAHRSKEERKAKVEALLELVGLQEHRNKYPSQLSGGQKQRVGIARALASDPEVLLCDEATSALDPQTTDSILRLLLDINRKLGLTILLITHEMHVIQSICDRVAVLHQGGIVEEGPVARVFLKPQHEVTKEFISRDGVGGDLLSQAYEQLKPGSACIYRITFLGAITYDSILSEVVRETGVHFAILQGTISRLKDTPYGQLTVTFSGPEEAVEETVLKLRQRELDVEVVA